MPDYIAPINEMKFTLFDVVDIQDVTNLEMYQDATEDIIDAVLSEGAKYAREILSPINAVGDKEAATLTNEGVKTATGFKEAYQHYAQNGWNSICSNPDFGGQGLPKFLGLAIAEMVDSANMSFSLCPILSAGAIEAIEAHGTDQQKSIYLEKLISGEWTGTMNLTESQAGSDVGALTTKAVKQPDSHYLIAGQKIFITYGDHDLTENIIHLVLARLPDAPSGIKGISLFIVPKFLINEDGSLGERNDVHCVSLEHKMGIMASPTCVMSYGGQGKCVGYLLGEENKGIQAMFTMMNNARLHIGVQGVACSERAWQMALDYARERIQGISVKSKDGKKGAIIDHPDVRRMLMTMKATTEAVRALTYLNVKAIDLGHHHPDETIRAKYKGLADLLTPMSKAYGTDLGVENSSLAMQVFGGMGYIQETGIAQIFRDARINPIYEGTNGIQEMDFVGRKLAIDGGQHWRNLLLEILEYTKKLSDNLDFKVIKANLIDVVENASECAEWLLAQHNGNMSNAMAGSVPFLRLLSTAICCYLMAKGASAARKKLDGGDQNRLFLESKIITARFYAEQIVPTVMAMKSAIMAGDELFFAIDEQNLAI